MVDEVAEGNDRREPTKHWHDQLDDTDQCQQRRYAGGAEMDGRADTTPAAKRQHATGGRVY